MRDVAMRKVNATPTPAFMLFLCGFEANFIVFSLPLSVVLLLWFCRRHLAVIDFFRTCQLPRCSLPVTLN